MLALGEIAPASVGFRTKLQKERRAQQSQSWWLHAVIEYGSGMNFVVDELLKTRAGENVLALLTAVISVLEGGAIEVLNLLFEKMNAPMYSIPSIGQLETIRATCLPLVRRMDFKDRLAELQHWLNFQFTPKNSSYYDPDKAIPDAVTMVKLVKILKDIAMQDKERRSKLVFCGARGAAWLILYAGNILGLSVCLVHQDGKTHPVSGTYSSADVLLYPGASDTLEVLQHIDRPSDVIAVACTDQYTSLSTNWLLSCDEAGIDFFGLFCKWDMKDRQEIGDVIYSIATEYIDRRIGITPETQKSMLYKFRGRDMTGTYDTLRQILHLLGLPSQFMRNKNWRELHFRKHAKSTGESRVDLELRLFSAMYEHVDQELHRFCSHVKLQPHELKHLPSYCPRCSLFYVTQEVAYFSSCLVFSDWHLNFRKISVRRLKPGGDSLSQLAYDHFKDVYADSQPAVTNDVMRSLLHSPPDDRVALAEEIAQICCGSRYSFDLIRSNQHKFLGINLDGVLLIEYGAIEPSLQEGPRLILREGEFSLGGDRRSLLVTSPFSGSSYYGCAVNVKNVLQPFNHFEGASLFVRASLQKDAIEMHYTFTHEAEDEEGNPRDLEVDVPVLDVITGLRSLLVTKPCEHECKEPLLVNQVRIGVDGENGEKVIYWKDSTNSFWHIQDTLIRHGTSGGPNSPRENRSPTIQFYPVENNPLGQWASVAFAQRDLKQCEANSSCSLTILQRQACLECTRDRSKQVLAYDTNHATTVCIIAGGSA
jgi:hypothetical protein